MAEPSPFQFKVAGGDSANVARDSALLTENNIATNAYHVSIYDICVSIQLSWLFIFQ